MDSPTRRLLGRVVPVLVGALVLGAAAAHPAPPVLGDVLTGPKPPAALLSPRLGPDYRLSWTDGHRAILLRVRDGADCRPPRPVETSTAPARIEVVVRRPTGPACTAAPRWWRFDLALPTVAEPGQGVAVRVNGMGGSVPRYDRGTSGSAASPTH